MNKCVERSAITKICLLENVLSKQPEVVLPVGRIVAVAVHMPHVRHLLRLKIGMNTLADTD